MRSKESYIELVHETRKVLMIEGGLVKSSDIIIKVVGKFSQIPDIIQILISSVYFFYNIILQKKIANYIKSMRPDIKMVLIFTENCLVVKYN